jgi:membrane associated rhomboid family serine protease
MLTSFIGGGIAGSAAQFSMYLHQQIKWENVLPSAKSWNVFGHTVTTNLAHWQKSAMGNIFSKVNSWRPCVGCSAGLSALMGFQACSNIVSLVGQMRGAGIKVDIQLFYQLSQLSFATLVIYEDITILIGSTISDKNVLGNLVAYSVDGVGHAAHIGGFLFGFLYYFLVIYKKVTPRA